ncbi:MAG TPA: hypothetical protein RMH85_18295 [Polyangiaceae bacterium LLY-WYZ-15_(1-7)]|nr:hypothetical protein [Polyangiaceae bacterium LLY-WYZ-15_(1-7)]HJL04238.1 hypothetical protein [Polyangiaceae bacterium LLY-WYZ-15_(1-7)]HJL10457.1 hypothetical protein [Polyangiaceae bacterium LLY-WYZ-15_(1-7)]HJL22483.1 hypothetical protein [Polyangiaceae bacterium LLY-WYZ-15_(1-7)]HJL31633.1 hypothetical protein [Polyangiaceae bacterium LLY-WYZ-15_(1-7)]
MTWRSGWSVDPERAARGYAVALGVCVVALGALLPLLLESGREAQPVRASLVALGQADRGARAVPWVLGTTLLAVMALGATKRCFGFGRGTLRGLGALALALGLRLLLPRWVSVAPSDLHTALVAGAGPGLCFAAGLALLVPDVGARRRGLAAFAWGALSAFAWTAAHLRFRLQPWLGDDEVFAVVFWAGLASGAVPIAALALWRSARGGADGAERL